MARSSSVPPRDSTDRSHFSPRSIAPSSACWNPPGIHSTTSSNACSENRSRGPSVRRSEAQARAAEAIFGPCIDPERSSTKTTSRAAPRNPWRAGGTRESKANPPWTSSCDFTCSPAILQRRTKSRFRGSRSRESMTRALSGPEEALTACCEHARSAYPPNSSTSTPNDTFGSKPGASRGGVIRDASGTVLVSGTTPWPACSRGSSSPPTYRGATTSGRRNSVRPSSKKGRRSLYVRRTTTASPGFTLPTCTVNTSSRSCSSSAARLPWSRACAYWRRASARSSMRPRTTRLPICISNRLTALLPASGKT